MSSYAQSMLLKSKVRHRIPVRHHEVVGQFVRYAVIGCLNVAVYFGIFNLLRVVGLHPNASLAVAFFLTSIQSFTLNKVWAFKDRRREALVRQYVVFVFFTTVGLAINQVAFTAFHLPLQRFGRIGENLAAFGAIPFSIMWNFLSYRRWTFKTEREVPAASEGSPEPSAR